MSKGLRSGLTVGATSLAIDKKNSKRLLYATGDDDGRPGTPLGGLWVSTNAAASWSHVPLCAPGPPGVVSVAFSAGQPYVSTNCGIYTNKSADLEPIRGWTALASSPTSPPFGSFVGDGGSGTLFACSGTQVFRGTGAGASRKWVVATIGGSCSHLTAEAANGSSASITAVVIWGETNGNEEVSTVNFGSSPAVVTNLNYRRRPGQVVPTKASPSQNPGGGGAGRRRAPYVKLLEYSWARRHF